MGSILGLLVIFSHCRRCSRSGLLGHIGTLELSTGYDGVETVKQCVRLLFDGSDEIFDNSRHREIFVLAL
ncbi:hypothetical protein ASD25_27340 [Brevundimonas sp. Root1423]|nr:hypothetical protein ASD25_27340 [Brevundimonas sp. Root1423]KRA26437.1 hypothetical protein ASD59_08070 [Brevundimonas sp. Root608]